MNTTPHRRALLVIAVVIGALGLIGPSASAESSDAPRATAVRTLVTGDEHSCALAVDGSVRCWGRNDFGPLGTDSTTMTGGSAGDIAALDPIPLGGRAVALAAGGFHTCAILDNGAVKCWGYNSIGQLGLDTNQSQGDDPGEMAALRTVSLGTGRTARAITAGYAHTCVILDNGAVRCWGWNSNGQLGQGSTVIIGDDDGEMATLGAVSLGTGRTARAITAGYAHTCVILDNGAVKCWGWNADGQLGLDHSKDIGDGSREMGDRLPTVALGAEVRAISAGNSHTCAVLVDGAVKCWGWGRYGQLGHGGTDNIGNRTGEMAALQPVALGRSARAISSGREYTCALLDDRSVVCWGQNSYGQLGRGDDLDVGDEAGEMGDAVVPVAVPGGRFARAVSAGGDHTCALLDDASIVCWGRNDNGQAGAGDFSPIGDGANEMGDALSPLPLTRRTGVAAVEISVVAKQRTVRVGSTITYSVRVRNTGDVPLSGVRISSATASRCARTMSPVPTEQSATFTCTLTARAATIGRLRNTVSVSTNQGVSDRGRATVTVTR